LVCGGTDEGSGMACGKTLCNDRKEEIMANREMSIEERLARRLIIGEQLARSSRKTPDKEVLVYGEMRLTYGELNRRVNRLANYLTTSGLGKGDKVGALFFNCNQIIEVYYACAKIGAIAVPLNFRLAPPEMIYILNDSDSRALVFGEAFHEAVEKVREEVPGIRQYICCGEEIPDYALSYNELVGSGDDGEPLVDVEEDDEAFIVYTSGTTGKPKGAVSTHKQQLIGAINSIIAMQVTRYDRFLFIPPLFHQGGVTLGIVYPLMNATMVIPHFLAFDPKAAMELIEGERISGAFLVAAMGNAIFMLPDLDKYDTSAWKTWLSTGGVFPVGLKKRILEQWPGMRIYDFFGMTEMCPLMTFLSPDDLLDKPESVGMEFPFVEMMLVDDDDKEVPIGQVGEGAYRGPTVMKEYYGKPEATEESMKGGWFHGGDLLRKDEGGFYYIVDRKKDMIVTGAENVYPVEVENAILANDKVMECAVIGVADEKWGEIVKAIVVLKPEETMGEDELKDFLSERLAGYKRPRVIEFLEALPRNAMGKVLKTELREKHGKLIRY